MKLSQLIQSLPILEKRHFSECEITGIAFDSRDVKPGNLFIAIPGTQVDGHDFVPSALKGGAVALILEKPLTSPAQVPTFRVENSRKALSRLSAHWNEYPSRDMHLIGVTGTNGKTTICYLLESILNEADLATGRIGTIGYHYQNHSGLLKHTTPESLEIQGLLRKMREAKVECVAMEVSSHAIDLNRVDDIFFDQAIFTNLTPEHLDYHKSMELYFESKKKLFTLLLPQGGGMSRSIINADDPFGQKLLETIKDEPAWSYSCQQQSKWDLFPKSFESSLDGLTGKISTPAGDFDFHTPLIGHFNLANILAATGAALGKGVTLKSIAKALSQFQQVPGRLERIINPQGIHVFVDYAHTPDALKNVLKTLRDLDPSKLITVFGCGGDRDQSKRPIMGREVARFSDVAVVTSDNPRTESPDKIIEDILPGIQEGGMKLGEDCQIEADRHRGIALGISQAKPGDVVLIAGKGHEDYQILGKQRIHFDDREIARQILGVPNPPQGEGKSHD